MQKNPPLLSLSKNAQITFEKKLSSFFANTNAYIKTNGFSNFEISVSDAIAHPKIVCNYILLSQTGSKSCLIFQHKYKILDEYSDKYNF